MSASKETKQPKTVQEKLKRTRVAVVLLLVIAVLLSIRLGWFGKGPVVLEPDYPVIDDDIHAKPTNDNETKLDVSENGGAVAVAWSGDVRYDRATEMLTLRYSNPSKSTQAVVVQAIVYGDTDETTGQKTEYLLAESGVLRPGFYLDSIPGCLDSSVTLSTGTYSGLLRIYFYNPNTGERAIVNTEIPLQIKVS